MPLTHEQGPYHAGDNLPVCMTVSTQAGSTVVGALSRETTATLLNCIGSTDLMSVGGSLS